MKSRNPLIQGVVIIPREIDLSKVRFLSKEEVIEYQEGVRTKYKDNPNALNSLDVISFDETLGEPKGSNFWALGELFSMGIPIAPTTTLDRLAEINPSTLTGTYEDVLSLVLRSEKDKYSKNNPVIQALMPQLKKRNVKRSIKYPVLISGAITPIEGKSEYGLVSRLNDQTNLHFNVGELAYSNHGKRFNTLDERGVPIFDENGTRTFYAKPSGLSRLYLNRNLNLNSNWNNLANSKFNVPKILNESPDSRIAQHNWLGLHIVMKPYKNIYHKIYSLRNLYHAYEKARKGKTKRNYVIKFESEPRKNILNLQKEIRQETYYPRPLKTFILRDPKTRKISKSDFMDRIVHHALVRVIEPIFDKTFIYDSCANRIGKGNLFAIKRFDRFKRKVSQNNTTICFTLKADIKHYFEEVNHEILLKIIKKKIKCDKTVWLIKKILANYYGGGGNYKKACH